MPLDELYIPFAELQRRRRETDPDRRLGTVPFPSGIANGLSEFALGVLPGSGDVMAAQDSVKYGSDMSRAFREGDYGRAASSGLLSLIAGAGVLPMVPSLTRGIVRAADTGAESGKVARDLSVEEAADLILARLGDRADEFGHYGIRITEDPLEVGGAALPSRIWVDGDPTDDVLHGASVVGFDPTDRDSLIRALEIAGVKPGGTAGYFGPHISILGSDIGDPGEDVGELILQKAMVLDALRRRDDMGPLSGE